MNEKEKIVDITEILIVTFWEMESKDNRYPFACLFNFDSTATRISESIQEIKTDLIICINPYLVNALPKVDDYKIYISITNANFSSSKDNLICGNKYCNGWVEDKNGNYLFGTL